MAWKTAADWNIGDAMRKIFLDDIFNNTLYNGQRLKILHIVNSSSYWQNNTTTYADLDMAGHFYENGDRLAGANKIRWEIAYNNEAGAGGGYVRLYNVTDSVAVSNSEVQVPSSVPQTFIQLPASEANYFSLVSESKHYRIEFKSYTTAKNFNILGVRLISVMPIA